MFTKTPKQIKSFKFDTAPLKVDAYKVRLCKEEDNPRMLIIASIDGEWEHVSVSCDSRTPTWKEMCLVKELFWDNNDTVVQIHPPGEQYVNAHEHCLHLWRKVDWDPKDPFQEG